MTQNSSNDSGCGFLGGVAMYQLRYARHRCHSTLSRSWRYPCISRRETRAPVTPVGAFCRGKRCER
jgi:hypothetical protein